MLGAKGCCANILEEQEDSFYAADGQVEIDYSEALRLVHCHLPVPQYPVIQNRKAALVLVIDHSSQLGVCDHVILEKYASDVVCVVGIVCGLDHTVVIVEREFILEPVTQCALVKWLVALKQLEVEWDEKAISESISVCLVSGNT